MRNYYVLHFPADQRYRNKYKNNARVLVKKTYILELIDLYIYAILYLCIYSFRFCKEFRRVMCAFIEAFYKG